MLVIGSHTTAMQRAIPAMFFRGGTSRGPFFLESDLPTDVATRDRVLLAAMGSPDPRQIDGLGGAHPLTSKVGIVRRSKTAGVDLDFLFAQLQPNSDQVATRANCGNMLAAVLPFALETGLVTAHAPKTTATVLTLDTGMRCEVTVDTPREGDGYRVTYAGDARIDGVPGTSAPVAINFLDTAGSIASGLLPTGHVRDRVHVEPPAGARFAAFDIDVTCIDNGMPVVLFLASDLGRTGYETPAALNADEDLKARLEALRLRVGELMGLGDVTPRNYPKMTLISDARAGGTLNTRCFIPHVCHEAIGVLASVTIATACVLDGSVAHALAKLPGGRRKSLAIEHPSGSFTVELELDPDDHHKVVRAALLRTARLIMRGEVLVPERVWPRVAARRATEATP